MSIYKKRTPSKVYRKIYKLHHGPIPKDDEGRTYDIHHIDGNTENNDPLNLVALSLKEHYNIHYSQGDFGAARLIAVRLNFTQEKIIELTKKAAEASNRKRVADGSHHLLGGNIQRDVGKRRVVDGSHNFLEPEFQRVHATKRVEDGTHHLLGSSHHLYDHTVYHFKNDITGEEVWSTRNELFKRYGLRRQGIMRIINDHTSTHLNWRRLLECFSK